MAVSELFGQEVFLRCQGSNAAGGNAGVWQMPSGLGGLMRKHPLQMQRDQSILILF